MAPYLTSCMACAQLPVESHCQSLSMALFLICCSERWTIEATERLGAVADQSESDH